MLYFYVAIVNVVGLIVSITVFFITIYKYNISMFVPNLTDCFLYLKDDRYIFFSSIITSLYTTTGIVLLGSLGSKIDVGYYSSAQKLIDVCRAVVLIPISQVIFPILSEKFGKDISSGISVVVKIMPVFFFISASCLLFLNVFSF
jgi:PST family polysaccharide transporter